MSNLIKNFNDLHDNLIWKFDFKELSFMWNNNKYLLQIKNLNWNWYSYLIESNTWEKKEANQTFSSKEELKKNLRLLLPSLWFKEKDNKVNLFEESNSELSSNLLIKLTFDLEKYNSNDYQNLNFLKNDIQNDLYTWKNFSTTYEDLERFFSIKIKSLQEEISEFEEKIINFEEKSNLWKVLYTINNPFDTSKRKLAEKIVLNRKYINFLLQKKKEYLSL